jgi:hypothetical protein
MKTLKDFPTYTVYPPYHTTEGKEWYKLSIPYTDEDYILSVLFYLKSRAGIDIFEISHPDYRAIQVTLSRENIEIIKTCKLFTSYTLAMCDRDMLTERTYTQIS